MRIAFVIHRENPQELFFLWQQVAMLWRPQDLMQIWLLGKDEETAVPVEVPKGPKIECYYGSKAINFIDFALEWMEQTSQYHPVDLVVMGDNRQNRQLAIGLGVRLNKQTFTDVYEIQNQPNGPLFARKACGSNLSWVRKADIVTLCKRRGKEYAGIVEWIQPVYLPLEKQVGNEWLIFEKELEKKPESLLETAKLVFIGGKGLGSKEACEQLRKVADFYHAGVGFSRPVALSGWCGMEEIVGQSGNKIEPEICVVLGVSGAAAFMEGIRGAGKIIAINADEDALIFNNADVGIVGDGLEILAGLKSKISEVDR